MSLLSYKNLIYTYIHIYIFIHFFYMVPLASSNHCSVPSQFHSLLSAHLPSALRCFCLIRLEEDFFLSSKGDGHIEISHCLLDQRGDPLSRSRGVINIEITYCPSDRRKDPLPPSKRRGTLRDNLLPFD